MPSSTTQRRFCVVERAARATRGGGPKRRVNEHVVVTGKDRDRERARECENLLVDSQVFTRACTRSKCSGEELKCTQRNVHDDDDRLAGAQEFCLVTKCAIVLYEVFAETTARTGVSTQPAAQLPRRHYSYLPSVHYTLRHVHAGALANLKNACVVGCVGGKFAVQRSVSPYRIR